jgi:Caspase domain
MSPFKGILLAACLLASLLAVGPTRSAHAQRAATETAAVDQSTQSLPLAQRSLQTAARPANPGNPPGLSGPEQRVALVIGNSNYQNVSQLSNPSNDAKAIAKLLNAAGFEVISATDLSHNEMIQVVQDFSSKIADRGPNTVAMVYYAGHGVQLAGENYLVPVDARISSETDLVNGSVRLVDVMATLDAIPSRLRIAILDACRNNPFPSLNEAGRGLAIVDAPNGSIVAYSTAPGSEALDGVGDHSPYTAAFLRLAHEKNLPIEQLFKRIRLDVNNSTGGQQTPWESSSLTSDFYFFGDTTLAATRPPAQEKAVYTADDLPSRASRAAYDYVLAENSIEHYQEFIQLYPHDPLCYRIRALLDSLMQAKAWHNAVLTNSPVAYKSFYDKFSSSPYAPSALKLAEQPKMVPLSQPTHIMVPASLKFGGLASGNHNTLPGKIVNLPAGGLNRSDALRNSKLDREVSRIDHRPEKSFSPIHDRQGPMRVSRSNFGRPPRSGNLSFASTQFHGSGFRPQLRPGGGGFGGHGFGGGGFGGGGFGRR